VRLHASDAALYGYSGFGYSVSLSGDNALVAGYFINSADNTVTSTVYYYQGLDSVLGNLTDLAALEEKKATYETVKLFIPESESVGYKSYQHPVSLDGDRFIVTGEATIGKAWAGDIRAFTTLDAGNDTGTGTALATDGLSFVSRTDWIIGAETANNTVTLTAGDTADITHADKAVYIGQTAGADNNTLIIEGTLTATDVYVGADGATGNTLRLTTAALETLAIAGTLYLDAGNYLEFEDAGQELDIDDVLTLLQGTATVQVRGSNSEGWVTLTSDNATTLLAKTGQEDGTWTRFTAFAAPAVPEPAAYAALAGLVLLAYAVAMRRPRGKRNRD
jgi:hypothetical protein